MRIQVAAVGKLKETYLRDAIKEYTKRLSGYADVVVTEVADEKTPDHAAKAVEDRIREKEGERLLQKIPEKAFVIALAIQGRMLSSEEFSETLSELMLTGRSDICFVIGGSLGLSPAVLKRADMELSFSRMTFPHQLMRVILLEQVYRAFKIHAGEPYHK